MLFNEINTNFYYFFSLCAFHNFATSPNRWRGGNDFTFSQLFFTNVLYSVSARFFFSFGFFGSSAFCGFATNTVGGSAAFSAFSGKAHSFSHFFCFRFLGILFFSLL